MTPEPANFGPSTLRGSSRVVTVCVVLLAVCAVGTVLTVLRSVVTPLLTGLLLLLLLNPIVSMLDARRVPRWLTYLLLFVVGSVAVLGVAQLIEQQGRQLREKLPEYKKRAMTVLDKYAGSLGFDNNDGYFKSGGLEMIDALPVDQEHLVSPALHAGLEIIELFTMAFFYLVFGLAESHRFSQRIASSFSDKSASEISSVITSIQNDIWSYLWTKTAISIGMGVTTAVIGWAFSLDFWLLWGVLMFLSNYITYIGSIVAVIPPILVAFVQFDSISAAIGFSVILVIARLIWIDYVEMRFSGKQVDVSPLLVLLAVALMGWMWGAVGMLLAVPLLTVARVILGHFPQTRYVASLISDLEE